MSFPADCPSCRSGDHSGHNPMHGTRPGLIGGSACSCDGDCAERAAARAAAFADMLRSVTTGQEAKR